MPTLIETATIEECAALCREVGLEFIEMNMNLPQYQVETMEEAHLKQVAKDYGIAYTIHLDENLSPADFSPVVAAAYRKVAVDTVEFAKKMEIPTLNMHLVQGVYFTLPHVKVYLFDKYRDYYRDNMLRFRDDVTRAAEGSGVKICIENWHGYTDYQIPVLDELLQSPAFGLTYDVGHNHCKKGLDEPVIMARKEKLFHMHLHDVKDGTKDHQALGTGDLDMEAILSRIKNYDKDAVLTLEGTTGGDILHAVNTIKEIWERV